METRKYTKKPIIPCEPRGTQECAPLFKKERGKIVRLKRGHGSPRYVESDQKKAAFKYYVELGDTRSYAKVARYFGISQITIGTWARAFDWENRLCQVIQRGEVRTFNTLSGIVTEGKGKSIKEIMECVDKLYDDIKIQNKRAKVYNKAIMRKIKEGKMTATELKGVTFMEERRLVTNLDDIDKGFKIIRELMGEPSQKTEIVNTTAIKSIDAILDSDPEVREIIAALYRKQFKVINGET